MVCSVTNYLWARWTSCLESETVFLCENGIVWSILGCIENNVATRTAPRMRFYAKCFLYCFPLYFK